MLETINKRKGYFKLIIAVLFFPKRLSRELGDEVKRRINESNNLVRAKMQKEWKEWIEITSEKQWMERGVVVPRHKEPLVVFPTTEIGLMHDPSFGGEITYNERKVETLRVPMDVAPPELMKMKASQHLAEHLVRNGYIECDFASMPGKAVFTINVID